MCLGVWLCYVCVCVFARVCAFVCVHVYVRVVVYGRYYVFVVVRMVI